MNGPDQGTGLLLQTLIEEIRSQRADLARNALELERLSIRVEQLHRDMGVLGALTERVAAIESARAEEITRGRVYASIGAAIAAAVGALAAMVVPWLLSKF